MRSLVTIQRNGIVAEISGGTGVSPVPRLLCFEEPSAVCELTNFVSGRTSADLDNYKTKIGLPSVLIDRTKVAPFPRGLKPICIVSECPGGPLTQEVGLELPSASETKMEAALSP